MTRTRLEPALPREMYVDEAAWHAERDAVLFGEWFCVGRRDDLGLHAAGRLAVVDVVGESVLVTSDERRRAARGVQRLPAPRLPAPLDRAGAAAASPVRRRRCAAPTTRGPTGWTAGCSRRRTPTWTTSSPRIRAAPGRRSRTWGGLRLRAPDPGARAAARRRGGPGRRRRWRNYGLGRPGHRRTLTYDVAANYKVLLENYNECYHCGPVHPELSRLVPAFAGGGAGLDWEDGIPHREGAWTFTTTGTTDRAPLPGLTEAERTRHKGELVYPNLMLSALGRPRGGVRAAPAGRGPHRGRCARCCSTGDEAAPTGSTPPTPRDLWDLVNRQDWAVCESVQRGMSSRAYRHGWFAPMEDDSLDIRRWLLPLLAGHDELSGSTTSSSGSGRWAAPRAMELARRGHTRDRARPFRARPPRGASHDTSRILRHSYHTPAYVRLTQEAYADWARLEHDTGSELVTRVGGLDLFPPDAAIPPVDYTTSPRRGRHRLRACSTATGAVAVAALRLPDGTIALHQADAAIVPAGRGTRTMQAQARRYGAELARASTR